jgi:hypothetical protein
VDRVVLARVIIAECLLVLYQGVEPGAGELDQLLRVVEREADTDLVGAPVSIHYAAEPSELVAQALVLRLEEEGRVEPGAVRRLATYTAEVTGGRRVVAVVWLAEVNAWVRRAIPAHLAKHARSAVAQRPGWARLGSELAVSFVACAVDGARRWFGDVHVVVSVLPEARPRRVRRLMPGGYLVWAEGVLRGAQHGHIDVAHWLVCGERNVHLAYWAAGEPLLLPEKLLRRS